MTKNNKINEKGLLKNLEKKVKKRRKMKKITYFKMRREDDAWFRLGLWTKIREWRRKEKMREDERWSLGCHARDFLY